MPKVFLTIFAVAFYLSVSGQNLKLTQQKLKDDFTVLNGHYLITFQKADLLQALDEIDKKLKTDNSGWRKQVADETLKQVNLASTSAAEKQVIDFIRLNVGVYLILKGKVSVFKDNLQLTEISMEEAPPEAELDGSLYNVFFFGELNTANWVFNGRIRTELRK
jgi:hypothetical protein